MKKEYRASYNIASLAAPANNLIRFDMPACTITRFIVRVADNLSGGDATFNVAKNDADIYTTTARLIVPSGSKEFDKAGVSEVFADGDQLSLDLEEIAATSANAPITFSVEFDQDIDLDMGGNNIDEAGVINMIEQAAADADVADRGQLWVKNTAPNTVWFTDDTGVDVQLGVGGVADGDKTDVTVTASGTVWTIDTEAVTYAKMQHVSSASQLLGRGSAGGAGDVEEISLGTNLSMSGTTLNAAGGGGGAGTFNIDDGTAAAGGTFTFDDGTAV